MTYNDLLDIMHVRARMILEQEPDAAMLLTYIYMTELEIAQTWDFECFMALPQPSEPWFVTEAGYEAYDLPEDFGRLLHPRTEGSTGERGRQGVRLFNGTSRSDLTFEDVITFDARDRTRTGRPSVFTLTGPQMRLAPLPDSNSGANYAVNGPYIRARSRPDFGDVVTLPEPKALISTTLVRMADDRARPISPVLMQEFLRDQTVLATNRAKQRQSFYDHDKNKPIGAF